MGKVNNKVMNTNVVYCGDCLKILQGFPNESIDLIYLDPPFFSNQHYEVIWGNHAEKRAFGDRWQGGMMHYINWMRDRIEQCHRVLKKTGVLFLHCDWHASHYLKQMLDKVFNDNFINEIIWKRTNNPKGSQFKAKKIGVATDSILVYSKTKDYTFNLSEIKKGLSAEEIKEKYFKEDERGRYYPAPIIRGASMGERPNLVYEYKGFIPKRYGWRMIKEKLIELDKRGDLGWSKNKMPFRKLRPEEDGGNPIYNLWDDVSRVGSGENLGYPTQKPLALMDRIITLGSNKGDIVLDPMMGGGTTLASAEKLNRKWVGIDVSPTACKVTEKRLGGLGIKDMVILGLPTSIHELQKLPPFEFQNWVCKQLNGKSSDRKSGDMGIDGYTLEGIPIQVKQSGLIGRNVVDNFETAIRRADKKKGIIVGFDFVKGAYEEVARIKESGDLQIRLLEVQEMLKADFNSKELF